MIAVCPRRSSTALACAVVPSEWNERTCICSFLHWTAAQAKAMLLREILRELFRFGINKRRDKSRLYGIRNYTWSSKLFLHFGFSDHTRDGVNATQKRFIPRGTTAQAKASYSVM